MERTRNELHLAMNKTMASTRQKPELMVTKSSYNRKVPYIKTSLKKSPKAFEKVHMRQTI